MTSPPSFSELATPIPLGVAEFRPSLEAVKKLGYGVDDESGWLIGDPADGLAHPVLLSSYLWWPQGFYVQEAGAIGHFDMFRARFEHLLTYPWLHAKTNAKFFRPFKIGSTLRADVSVADKYERRQREFIVLRAAFSSDDGPVAVYEHTIMIKSHAPVRGIEKRP